MAEQPMHIDKYVEFINELSMLTRKYDLIYGGGGSFEATGYFELGFQHVDKEDIYPIEESEDDN